MSQVTLESLADRVAALENLVAQMREAQGKPPRNKDWRRTIGMFAGDELMKEIFQAGREIRDAEPEDSEP